MVVIRSFSHNRQFYLLSKSCILFIILLIFFGLITFDDIQQKNSNQNDHNPEIFDSQGAAKRAMATPLLFIGGSPRSGTTLLRVLLDSHPSIRCGAETHVLQNLMILYWRLSLPYEKIRLKLAGIDQNLLYSAMRNFMLEIIQNHQKKFVDMKTKDILYCNKDPLLMNNAIVIQKLFPKAKFIHIVRDGRAVVNSLIKRQVIISNFNLSDYGDCLKRWNRMVSSMNYQCSRISKSCLTIHYEQLILNPKYWMSVVLKFIGVPWNDSILKHDQLIKSGRIQLSLLERSTEQVIKPINLDALTSWVKSFPFEMRSKIDSIAPMLKHFGYDPHSYPPDYGRVDEFVLRNMEEMKQQSMIWAKREKKVIDGRKDIRKKLNEINQNIHVLNDRFEEEHKSVNEDLIEYG